MRKNKRKTTQKKRTTVPTPAVNKPVESGTPTLSEHKEETKVNTVSAPSEVAQPVEKKADATVPVSTLTETTPIETQLKEIKKESMTGPGFCTKARAGFCSLHLVMHRFANRADVCGRL